MQNTQYPSGPILKAGLEGACPVERCLPIPGFHRNGGMLNFCKVLSQLVSIPLLFIAVICVQSALLAPWRKCHLFTLVLISVFTVLAKTIQFIQLKSFLLQSWLLGSRLYFMNLENQGQTMSGFHLHILVIPFVSRFHFRIEVLVCSSFANDQKSNNLQYNTLVCWFAGTNDTSPKRLMCQVFFFS